MLHSVFVGLFGDLFHIQFQQGILLHFGTNSVNLKGEGYQVMVELHQKVKTGDVLWQADLAYIQAHATDANIMLVVTQSPEGTTLKKSYGYMQQGAKVLEIYD